MHDEVLHLLADLTAVPGVGVDTEAVDRWGDPDPRLFTVNERSHCLSLARPAEGFAGRWCAKEAVVKALTPFARVAIRDVEILVGADGRPLVRLAPQALIDDICVVVSISHTASVAVAVAAARRRPRDDSMIDSKDSVVK